MLNPLHKWIRQSRSVIDGKVVHLEPSFKIISLKASKDSTVTYQEEFLDDEAGVRYANANTLPKQAVLAWL